MSHAKHLDTESGHFGSKKEPLKSFQVFLRNQNKFYVNSFNMIDRKAAIMIRMNSIIISIIVVFFRHLKNLDYTFIGIVMVICGFISLLFAIDASRPHLFSMLKRYRKRVEPSHSQLEENIFVLGKHDHVTLQEYENAYRKLMESQDLQIGNQVRAMYIFENRIRRSFTHIEISYISFMIGFIIVVLSFIYSNIEHLF